MEEYRRIRASPGAADGGPSEVIDEQGYRPNVGIILANSRGDLLWARRRGQNAWQFPQGGIHEGETPEQAMFRELGALIAGSTRLAIGVNSNSNVSKLSSVKMIPET